MFRQTLTLSLVLLVAPLAARAVSRGVIPAGTILQCTMNEPNFSAKTAMVGDPVLCHLGPLGEFGHSMFPRGAMLGGHLQDYKDPGHFFGKGSIGLEFDRLVLPGAEILPLSAKIISAPHMKVDRQGDIQGKGHPKRDAIEWMIPILWPIKVATLASRGPYPALKGESRLSLRVMEDVEVPFPVAWNIVPAPPWASPSSYPSAGERSQYDVPRPPLPRNSSLTVTPASYSTRSAAPAQPSDPRLTVIALKSGAAIVASQYWVQGGEMRCVSASGEQRIPLDQLDLYRTTTLNRERNLDFVLQSRDAVEQ